MRIFLSPITDLPHPEETALAAVSKDALRVPPHYEDGRRRGCSSVQWSCWLRRCCSGALRVGGGALSTAHRLGRRRRRSRDVDARQAQSPGQARRHLYRGALPRDEPDAEGGQVDLVTTPLPF